MDKYCAVEVTQSKYGDCSNDGLSATHGFLVLTNGNDETYKGLPCIRLNQLRIGQNIHLSAQPMTNQTNLIGPMNGGATIHSNDPTYAELTGTTSPINLHDRYETQREYDLLSM